MSRNFELLSQMGKFEELLQSEPETVAADVQPVAPVQDALHIEEENFPSTPVLNVNPTVRDEVRKLVQGLFLGVQGPKQVIFTGTESGCGSTWMCAHAAHILAETPGRVCIVDCNLLAPGLHQLLQQENHHGLSDALAGGGSIHQYARRLSRNLWLLSCGSEPKSSQPLLGSAQMRSRLTELRATFDYTLIDTAPLNASTDAIVLGAQTDGVVLMLKANSSRRESAKKALQDIRAANVRTLGAVLNQRTFPIPDKLYKLL